MSRHYLNVPYRQRDQAKHLNCHWNPDKKLWYAINPSPEDLDSFKQFGWTITETKYSV